MKLQKMRFRNKKITLLSGIFFLVISSHIAQAQQPPSPLLVMAREELPGAFKSEANSITLYNKLKDVKNPDPLLKGYIGASNFARARYAPLIDKRSFLKTGTLLLEEAIKEKPNTTELIFLRLTIQTKLPSFLGYNDNIESDKKFVLEHYNTTPSPLKERIGRFIGKSENFTEEEKAMVR